jgi:hypothetical protein
MALTKNVIPSTHGSDNGGFSTRIGAAVKNQLSWRFTG